MLPYLFLLFKDKSSITLQAELKSNFSISRGNEDPDSEFTVYSMHVFIHYLCIGNSLLL